MATSVTPGAGGPLRRDPVGRSAGARPSLGREGRAPVARTQILSTGVCAVPRRRTPPCGRRCAQVMFEKRSPERLAGAPEGGLELRHRQERDVEPTGETREVPTRKAQEGLTQGDLEGPGHADLDGAARNCWADRRTVDHLRGVTRRAADGAAGVRTYRAECSLDHQLAGNRGATGPPHHQSGSTCTGQPDLRPRTQQGPSE